MVLIQFDPNTGVLYNEIFIRK